MKFFKREPDFIVGGKEDPYLLRWYIIPQNRFFNIYLHKFLKSDEDRAVHSHPWWSMSVKLKGDFYEELHQQFLPDGKEIRRKAYVGRVKFRSPRYAHRIVLRKTPSWTLFITGPKICEWGFLCKSGWRHWREFTDKRDSGQVGRGCD